jgi:hypothetical protein
MSTHPTAAISNRRRRDHHRCRAARVPCAVSRDGDAFSRGEGLRSRIARPGAAGTPRHTPFRLPRPNTEAAAYRQRVGGPSRVRGPCALSCCGPMAAGRVSILKEHRAPPASASPRRGVGQSTSPVDASSPWPSSGCWSTQATQGALLLRYRLVILARFWRRRNHLPSSRYLAVSVRSRRALWRPHDGNRPRSRAVGTCCSAAGTSGT